MTRSQIKICAHYSRPLPTAPDAQVCRMCQAQHVDPGMCTVCVWMLLKINLGLGHDLTPSQVGEAHTAPVSSKATVHPSLDTKDRLNRLPIHLENIPLSDHH